MAEISGMSSALEDGSRMLSSPISYGIMSLCRHRASKSYSRFNIQGSTSHWTRSASKLNISGSIIGESSTTEDSVSTLPIKSSEKHGWSTGLDRPDASVPAVRASYCKVSCTCMFPRYRSFKGVPEEICPQP